MDSRDQLTHNPAWSNLLHPGLSWVVDPNQWPIGMVISSFTDIKDDFARVKRNVLIMSSFTASKLLLFGQSCWCGWRIIECLGAGDQEV